MTLVVEKRRTLHLKVASDRVADGRCIYWRATPLDGDEPDSHPSGRTVGMICAGRCTRWWTAT